MKPCCFAGTAWLIYRQCSWRPIPACCWRTCGDARWSCPSPRGWAEATEADCWVERNGEAVYSGYCGDISRGPVGLEPWTYPFAEGDTLEYHFLCTDQYGLRYDFTLYKRTAEEREDGPSFPGRKNEENLCATSP
ncbi:hypothetical protein [uncultured Oscillibacter sp.]|uniref:hypothetical protein n=1 Tax=uncultured Oscillibacter sp. TaxID=876091 RepID=UPI002638928A|nr:hypothetical protein [uncultured Oscillibacter sp.]